MRLNKHLKRTSFILSWPGRVALFLMVVSVINNVSKGTLPVPVRAELISEMTTIQPGNTLSVGLLLKMDEYSILNRLNLDTRTKDLSEVIIENTSDNAMPGINICTVLLCSL